MPKAKPAAKKKTGGGAKKKPLSVVPEPAVDWKPKDDLRRDKHGNLIETKRMLWEEWDAYRAEQLGVRDFATDPLARPPKNRTNSVRVAGNLKVSSDVAAWLKTLPVTAPRNGGVRFYDLDPKAQDYVEASERQASAAAALSALGLTESGASYEPGEVIAEGKPARGGRKRMAKERHSSEEPKRARPTREKAPKPAKVKAPPKAKKEAPARRGRGPSPKGENVPPPAVQRARQSNAVRRAYRDYVLGRAVFQKGTYYVRNARSGALTAAPWDELIRERFSTPKAFYKAALEWGQSWPGLPANRAG